MRKQTLVSSLATRFIVARIDIRADANIHKAIACKFPSIISARLSESGTMVTFASDTSLFDTLRPRDTVGSEGVAAVCSAFCARSWVS